MDTCPACGCEWHGLTCAKVEVTMTGAGLVQTPCGCPGLWAAA